MQAKHKAEEVKQAALEAERKAATEAKTKAAMEAEKRTAAEAERRAEKDLVENSKMVTSGVTLNTTSSLLNTEAKESGMVFSPTFSSHLEYIFPMSVFSLDSFLHIQHAIVLCKISRLWFNWCYLIAKIGTPIKPKY